MENMAQHTCETLVSLYQEISDTRMEGVPILNNALSVAAFGFEDFQEYRLGVLLTPWFMNLVLLPLDASEYTENAPQVGTKVSVNLPAGKVEFIVGFEDAIGHSLSCSLFSPVFEFEDQDAAIQTAEAALAEVMNPDAETEDEDPDMTDVWAGKLPEPELAEPDETEEEEEVSEMTETGPVKDVNRRDFLRGGRARDRARDAEPVDQIEDAP